MEPPEERSSFQVAQLVHADDTVGVPNDRAAEFSRKLSKLMFTEGPFAEGEGLIVENRFVQYDDGSRFKRYLFGGAGTIGQGSLGINVTFKNPEGTELAAISSGGKIGAGFFGGSMNTAIEKAAEEVADFATANFR